MRTAILFLFLVLPVTAAFALQEKVPDNFPRIGEMKLHGKIVFAAADHKSVILRVDSLMMPNGHTSNIDPTRDKLVLLTPETICSSNSIQQLADGQEISAIGPSSGGGKPLKARYIVCPIPGSNTVPLTGPLTAVPTTKPSAPAVSVEESALPPLNRQLVQFCRESTGQKIGNGQCTALVETGLKQIGAAKNFSDYPGDGDYVWGRLVYFISVANGAFVEEGGAMRGDPVLPGDIIQFRDAGFRSQTSSSSSSVFSGHYTAVVGSVANKGRVLTIFQQNNDGQVGVIESQLRIADLKDGWLRIYRPVNRAYSQP